MGAYELTGVFNAIDNISGVAGNIGSTIANMALSGIDALSSLGKEGFDPAALAASAFSLGVEGIIQVGGMAVDSMIQMDTAMNKVSATTGFTGENLAQMKKITEDLFNSGLTSKFDDAAGA